jgi:lipid II:glycine glycyltransferase (peptidoglycan interpeptide bridge formation enzyme)
MYDTPVTAHTQYIAATDAGRERFAGDLLIDRLIGRAQERGQRWFDFGISTVEAGRVLNEGLAAYKEGFGARGVVFDAYEIEL